MHEISFFIRDILSSDNWGSFTEMQRATIEQYLVDLQCGPADGEMDIQWQETGKGYYLHLMRLGEFKGDARDAYLARLRDDICVCGAIWPGNYCVESVAKKIFGTAVIEGG